MNNVPFKFREDVAALLKQPLTDDELEEPHHKIDVICGISPLDSLWTEAFQKEWTKRVNLKLALYRTKDNTWKYKFWRQLAKTNEDTVKSEEDLKRSDEFRYFRVTSISINGSDSANLWNKKDLMDLQSPLPSLMHFVRHMIPSPAPSGAAINIEGPFDEAAELEIAESCHNVHLDRLVVTTHKSTFDPILQSFLKTKFGSKCQIFCERPADWQISTTTLLRNFIQAKGRPKKISLRNNTPLTFEFFQAVFEWSFASDYVAVNFAKRLLGQFSAYFEEDVRKRLKTFKPDLKLGLKVSSSSQKHKWGNEDLEITVTHFKANPTYLLIDTYRKVVPF